MKRGRKFSEQADFRETVSNIATRSFFSYRSKHRVSQSVPSTRASLPINHTARSLSPPSLSSFFPHSSFLPTPARLSTCFVGRADESSKRKGFSLCNVTDTPCIRPENRKPIPRSHLIPWNGDAEKSNRLDVLFLAKKPSKAEIDSMLFRPASSRYVHSTYTSWIYIG